ncbi:DUF2017 family protein [Yonghaparkia sp. Root332]|uniref:DUF2017 family protein n=1 Tax=Yonghaparkia sp. Root332 TaxID=1736516 RepID=UPI0006FBBD57|nr:DUF2017 family protein [Yonghaparkia sp. Root332]KQV24646.1 hypothetical protein ASC54_08970 [Yonghaparkia sp. Root332]
MRGFVVVDGGVEAALEPEEARILASLAAQLSSLLGEAADDEALSDADPAVARLLPDAYRDDEEAAAEWRRLSRRALAERKGAFASRFAADLADAAAASQTTRIRLDEAGAIDWMRAIGDLRLVLAERMEVGDDREGMSDLYDWLAWMQDDLVRVLDLAEERGA